MQTNANLSRQLANCAQWSRNNAAGTRPVFFRLHRPEEAQALHELLKVRPHIQVFDELEGQLRELVKSLHPHQRFSAAALQEAALAHVGNTPLSEYGVWVYYPWAEKLIHILEEDEFIELRTNRNQHKITKAERDLLATKKIGIIGLSVGASVALTLAMERVGGELRLADFDVLELSNYNRIRTSLCNLGIPKVVAVAREIAEIDPFLKVVCYTEGITEENLDRFFLKGGKLDILVEECDSLDIKILSRYKAREFKIPVIMDTSDRGMIDIERFDLEPNRRIFHGRIPEIDTSTLKDLNQEQRMQLILQIVGNNLSERLQYSMGQIGKTITTWPQLASSVTLGSGGCVDIARKILLNAITISGRYYLDIDQLIS